MEWRTIDLKIIIWIVMVGLQQIGGSYLIRSAQLASGLIRLYTYDQLVFEFNIVYAVILVLNVIIRHYVSFNDANYVYISKIHLAIHQQHVTDIFCLIICLIYTTRVILLIF